MAMISPKSTARRNQDFTGSDVTIHFKPGNRTENYLLFINDDGIAERDEIIIIQLVDAKDGASITEGTGNNVTVIIQANDVVAGYVGFNRLSQAVVAKEGEMVRLEVVRSSPAAGVVTVDWIIQGQNATRDFNETSGIVFFDEVLYGINSLILAMNCGVYTEFGMV